MVHGAALLLSLLLASATVEEIQQAVQSTYDGGGYQTRHPVPRPHERQGLPEIPDALGGILEALLWTGVAVLVVLITVAIVRRLRGHDADEVPRPHPRTVGAAPPRLDAPLADADALAAEGRYGDAAHVLLLRTIQALARHQRVPASYTSREILRRLELPDVPHDALERLVRVVEVTLFGGRPARLSDYDACVEAFQTLRASFGEAAS